LVALNPSFKDLSAKQFKLRDIKIVAMKEQYFVPRCLIAMHANCAGMKSRISHSGKGVVPTHVTIINHQLS
jgi:hypothetical protein